MWYTKAFSKEPYFNEPFYVGFNIGGYELGLMPEDKPVTNKTKNVMSLWGVNDIQQTFDHLIAVGAKEHKAPYNVGGDLMVAEVTDPWNNLIGFIYNPHFKAE
ncbi:MAG: VOC family protein [Saprospiraceae bacterium]|nr:VOC family protein [Saprospiraceae bacterium]